MKRHIFFLIAAALVLGVTHDAAAEVETFTGRLSVMQVDVEMRSGFAPSYRLLLTDDKGLIHRLELSEEKLQELGGPYALRGLEATVIGEQRSAEVRIIEVLSLELADGALPKSIPQPTFGSQPCVTLLFKYSDIPDETEPKSYFDFLISGPGYPSIDHYFREVSYENINLLGSEVHGWYTLDHPYSHYNRDIDNDGNLELDTDVLLLECLGHADADVNFPDFELINFMFNGKMSCNIPPDKSCAFSQADQNLFLDGVWKTYGLTYQGPWAIHRQDVVPHEMFHTFGVPHSSGPYAETYDSGWDIMSGAQCEDFGPPHPTYGCMGAHTIAWHKFGLGWIPPARVYNPGVPGSGMVLMDRLAFPTLAAGTHLLALMPVVGSFKDYLTAEYRTYQGYDGVSQIPGEAVILHMVDITRGDRLAQVIDATTDNNPNDEGAMWRPGESVLITPQGLIVYVESWNSEHALLSMSNSAQPTAFVNGGFGGNEYGTFLNPWNSIVEGYASVYTDGTVVIQPGSYPESFTFSKPCVLSKAAGGGDVVIGQ